MVIYTIYSYTIIRFLGYQPTYKKDKENKIYKPVNKENKADPITISDEEHSLFKEKIANLSGAMPYNIDDEIKGREILSRLEIDISGKHYS